MTVKNFDGAKKAAYIEQKPKVLEFLKKIGKFLLPVGDRFTTKGLTFGEINLFCHLYCYANGALPEVKDGVLAPFYERMAAVPGIKKVLDGKSQFGQLGAY